MTPRLVGTALVLAALTVGGGSAPAQAAKGCNKGTICRQAIEGGFVNCKAAARAKWQRQARSAYNAGHMYSSTSLRS
jgi:hypothetical protein